MIVDPYIAALIIFGTLLIFFAAGLPIAFAMGLAGFFGLIFFVDLGTALNVVSIQVYSVPTNFVLLACPLFILMAQIIIFTGLGTTLYDAMEVFLSGTPGSLALASLGAGTVFASASGASEAACAAIGPVAMEEMTKRGYSKTLAAGSVAGAGGLAIIIPPSILFILYGFVTQTSVTKLFMAGVFPGLLMASLMSLYIVIRSKLDPSIAPAIPKLPWKKRLLALLKIWPMVGLMVLVLGCIYTGITTPTEAAAVGVLGSLLLAIGYRKINYENMKEAILATTRITSFVFLIVVGSITFGFLMSYLRIPHELTAWIKSSELSPWTVLILANIMLMILGMVIDAVTMVMVVIPLLLPALRGLGFDPIWLGVILCVNVEMALLTPPVGMNLYVLTGVVKEYGAKFSDVAIGTMPFLAAQIFAWILVMVFPSLATWLPGKAA